MITGTLRHQATLDQSGASLDPPTWYCAAADDGQGQQTLSGRYHPGIGVHTRVHLKGRIYHVDSVINVDERDRELILRCTEVFDV